MGSLNGLMRVKIQSITCSLHGHNHHAARKASAGQDMDSTDLRGSSGGMSPVLPEHIMYSLFNLNKVFYLAVSLS